MGPSELLEHVVSVFERLGIPYLVTGSVAAMAYGEPRLTNDIDIVAGSAERHIPEKHLRDITGILMTTGAAVDRQYIERWAQQLGLVEIWEAIEKRLGS